MLSLPKNYAVKDNIYSALLQKRIADKEKSYHEAFQKEVHKEASTISESIEMQEAFLEQERINTIFSMGWNSCSGFCPSPKVGMYSVFLLALIILKHCE